VKEIEAEMRLDLGRIQLVREIWNDSIDVVGSPREHRLEFALIKPPETARGCFPDHWGPHRFERIGQLFLFPAEQTVHAKSDCRQQHSIVCSFDPAAVARWFGELPWTHGRLQCSLDIASANIRSLLLRIGEEMRVPRFAHETMVELMTAQVAIELARHLTGMAESMTPRGLAAWRMRLIEERLSDGSAPPSLSELAGLTQLSVRQMTRSFRISRGRSIGSYMAERSLEHAKRLLASGDRVKSVAFALGFTAPSNFATAFQRATGETPRQYRQRASRQCAAAR
jgi:AraC family transcriptional regulator